MDKQARYLVRIVQTGSHVHTITSMIRNNTSSSLEEAKKAICSVPFVVATGLSRSDAEKLRQCLEAAGAVAEIC